MLRDIPRIGRGEVVMRYTVNIFVVALVGVGCDRGKDIIPVFPDTVDSIGDPDWSEDLNADSDTSRECTSACTGRECGPDPADCVDSCGACEATFLCQEGECVCASGVVCHVICCQSEQACYGTACCTPQCDGRECGPDSCGGECGVCDQNESCDSEGVCLPLTCGGRTCPYHPQDFWYPYCNDQDFCEYANPNDEFDVEIWVAEGTFSMGLGGADCPGTSAPVVSICSSSKPQQSVVLEYGFFMDKYEVTISMYHQCIEQGACPSLDECPDITSCCAKDGGNLYDTLSPDAPVICLDKASAELFCEWTGQTLPSEAEWAKSVTGDQQHLWVWGEEPIPGCAQSACCDCEPNLPVPVGSREADKSPIGAMDMAGNVSEFVLDCWHQTYEGFPSNGEVWDWDCDGDLDDSVRRGGGWNTPWVLLYGAVRTSSPPIASGITGFRCARIE